MDLPINKIKSARLNLNFIYTSSHPKVIMTIIEIYDWQSSKQTAATKYEQTSIGIHGSRKYSQRGPTFMGGGGGGGGGVVGEGIVRGGLTFMFFCFFFFLGGGGGGGVSWVRRIQTSLLAGHNWCFAGMPMMAQH